ncbi:MAG: YceI family protein [Alphaproteobacteria bacterium]
MPNEAPISRRAGGAIAVAAVLAPTPAWADFERFAIDPDHFAIGFMTHHLGYEQVLGMFLEGAGTFEYDAEAQALRNVEITVQAASVFTNHDARDGHLRSGDFLDAEANPVIRFVGTSAEATGASTGIVHGDLTLRGETRPVSFTVTLNKAADYPFGAGPPYVLGISARGTVVRSEFGSTYAVGNGWVGDEIALIVELEAIRQAE